MGVSSGLSCVISLTASLVVFAGMQVYKNQLGSSKLLTIFGGYLSSIFFMLVLTAVGNLESAVFGRSFQTKLIPEVIGCLVVALFAAAMVHRVCITTGLIFSLVALYYMNKISGKAVTANPHSLYHHNNNVISTTNKKKQKQK